MTSFILSSYDLKSTGADGGHKYLSAKVFYCGVEQSLSIFFKDRITEENFNPIPIIAICGTVQEDIKNLSISLLEASQTDLPTGKDWVAFITQYFLENNISVMQITESAEGYIISTFLEHYYLWCRISKDKQVIKKFEFGRYLPLETIKYVKKSTNWTKGVMTNLNENFIEFRQTSWDGEEGDKYTLNYSKENEEKLLKFLAIPFHKGWVELDYRLGENGFYKASGAIKTDNGLRYWTYTLLHFVEQDIPFLTDKLDKWIRSYWGDSFINNYRRHIDKTEILPIVISGNSN